MPKTKLKPYVIKVKGAKKYALYNLLNGEYYSITPEGSVEELKKSLKEAGLTFETEGTVPFELNVDFTTEMGTVQLRELQVRVNGTAENNCWERKNVIHEDEAPGEKRRLDEKLLPLLKEEFSGIPVKKLKIEEETDDLQKIGFLLRELPREEVDLFVRNGVEQKAREAYESICRDRDVTLVILTDGKKDIAEIKFDSYNFFYSRHFNPCLGGQVAVDCGGEIKPCLWAKDVLGSIGKDNIRNMIISGKFDDYWKQTKDKIDVCKDCEMRYACNDCRVNEEGSMTQKPSFCTYDPFE
jgi:radical SAM protein with 4Fe4S-binding SPASM domain